MQDKGLSIGKWKRPIFYINFHDKLQIYNNGIIENMNYSIFWMIMMKKLLILALIVFDILAMELPEQACGVKRSMQNYPEVKRQKGIITLISSDGKEFRVSQDVAEQSKTIKGMIEDFGTEIPLPRISSSDLSKLLQIMVILDHMQGASPLEIKRQLNALDFYPDLATVLETWTYEERYWYPVAPWITLLLGANYLDLPMAMDFLAEKLAENIGGQREWDEIKHAIVKDLYPLIGKYYYLTRSDYLKGIDFKGVSIKELLEYGRINFGLRVTQESRLTVDLNRLDLSNLAINKLDGLLEIPHIKEMDIIDLSNNKLTGIPKNSFNGLKLNMLNLNDNHIQDIDHDSFAGLEASLLGLKNNQIFRLIPDTFAHTNISLLSLIGNELKTIEKDDLRGLESVRRIFFDSNKLENVDTQAFSNMHNLTKVTFKNNPLSDEQKAAIRDFFQRRSVLVDF